MRARVRVPSPVRARVKSRCPVRARVPARLCTDRARDLGGDVHVSLVSVRARVLGGNNCARTGTYKKTVRAQIASVRARRLSLYLCAHGWPRARTGSPRARTGRVRIRGATHAHLPIPVAPPPGNPRVRLRASCQFARGWSTPESLRSATGQQLQSVRVKWLHAACTAKLCNARPIRSVTWYLRWPCTTGELVRVPWWS